MSAGEIKAPKATLTCTHSFFSKSKSQHDWVETHWFNHKVDVVLPNVKTENVTKLLQAVTKSDHFYYLATTSFSVFVNPQFINSYVKKGKLYVISTGTPLDTSNVCLALFNGKLELVVNKDTYEQLGLVGSQSAFPPHGQRFNIIINLLQPSFVPGRKFYERVKSCLQKFADSNFIFSFSTDGISQQIEFPTTTPHKKLPFHFQQTEIQAPTPLPSSLASITDDDLSASLYDFHSWSEFVQMSIKPPDLSKEGHSLNYKEQKVTTLSWTGLIPPSFVHGLITLVREEMGTDKKDSFAVVTVKGFEDSPVSWGVKEHGYTSSGENSYDFFIFPNDEFWFYCGLGECDEYK